MTAAAEIPEAQIELIDYEQQDRAVQIAKVALGTVEMGLLASSPFLGPEITIPAAVGVAVAGAIIEYIEYPPDLKKFGEHLSQKDVRAVADSVFTYTHETAIRNIKGNIPEATHSAVNFLSKGVKIAVRGLIYCGVATET